jgi:hypothetical protein
MVKSGFSRGPRALQRAYLDRDMGGERKEAFKRGGSLSRSINIRVVSWQRKGESTFVRSSPQPIQLRLVLVVRQRNSPYVVQQRK